MVMMRSRGCVRKALSFLKNDTVLTVSWVLAAVSAFLVPPDREYIRYLDIHTLAMLFCLMTVMAGFQELGIFRYLAARLLGRVKKRRQLEAVLILLPFFCSMLITNDVALITFVPFGLEVLKMSDREADSVFVVVMQTIGANLGSSLLPMGNPQNLYLYGRSGYSVGEFASIMLPYTLISLALICILLFCRKNGTVSVVPKRGRIGAPGKLVFYGLLFCVCLLVVAKLLSVWIAAAVILCGTLIFDRRVLCKVDYALLLTFCGFFVFIGNLGRIPVVSGTVSRILQGHEVLIGAAASQIISNVPAALFLSAFTERWGELMIGVNLGGLGTMIASMASLISYKYIARYSPQLRGAYFCGFTKLNLLFLAVLLGGYALIAVCF